jgi:DNA-binding NtrC family response regulator
VQDEPSGIPTRAAIERLQHMQAREHFVGQAPAFLAAIQRIDQIAQSQANVVISGETGTGKELVARALHYSGPRAEEPFVPVNCGSLPDSLLEDELFGHERGAFTDARSRRDGLIMQANGGTLFLDEVDALSPRAQVALLRVLQDRTVRRLGSEQSHLVDVRFVAASNAPLGSLVHTGGFRSDLYFRLCVLLIDLPPLRAREGDVLLLARHFLDRYAPDGTSLHLDRSAEMALLRCPWPGNVRELENVIQRAVTFARGPILSAADLGLPAVQAPAAAPSAPRQAEIEVAVRSFREEKRAAIEAFERDYLLRLMRTHAGNITRAAQAAGKERRDLGRLLKKYRLAARA